MTTERDMLNMLNAKYTHLREGAIADKWIRCEHVRSSQDWGAKAIADFVAIDKWRSSQSLIGHEVKVSRSDWLREVKDFKKGQWSKSELVKKYCNQWYLVVSDPAIVKDGELPDDWGLMCLSSKGDKLITKKKAPALDPVPMTLDFTVGLASSAARTAQRAAWYRDASTVRAIPWAHDGTAPKVFGNVCAECGYVSPCPLHQPMKWKDYRSRGLV